MQIKIPCVIMRGGTSRGPYFLASDLPQDIETRDRVLLAAMGSPHVLQIDGIGGGHPLTSKVAIVSPSSQPGAEIDYLFAQVSVDKALVDTNPNCGNMLSGIGPFAIEAGLIKAKDGETKVSIFNVNTDALIDAFIQTPEGEVEYEGNTSIDGVPGTAAPVKLNFRTGAGSKTGKLFPTGKLKEEIDGVPVTLIDYAMPMMLVPAEAVGVTGKETPAEFDANTALLARLEGLRREAGKRMGLGDVSEKVIPKIGLISTPVKGTVTSRYFVPDKCHKSHAVTGALCVATAARTPGTIAYELAAKSNDSVVSVEHPSGKIDVDLDIQLGTNPIEPVVRLAAVLRTTRRLFEGSILIPARVWPDHPSLKKVREKVPA